MSKIKYICLSDLHLGAPTALLTDTPAVAGAAESGTGAGQLRDAFSAAFVATLAAFKKDDPPAELPGVVLLGDIFDLSLGTPKSSIDTFDTFLKSLASAGAHERLGSFFFVPGNHDHELWTVTRYQNMVGALPADNRYQHTTPAFGDPGGQPATALIDQILRNNKFQGATTFYPNMGLVSEDQSRVVVLHHGHFVESTYRAMSTLISLLDGKSEISFDAETLEALNSSWIDFLWSSDGDNGRLGAEIRRAYHAQLTGGEGIKLDHRLAHILAEKLAARLPLPRTAKSRDWTENAAKAFVDTILGSWGQMERFSYQQTLSADSIAGLKSYISGAVLKQVSEEIPSADVRDLTFVFGHTHKPFEARIAGPGQAMTTAVYNTGGWDLDTPVFGTRLGAAAVFIDDDLNVASLRICDVPQPDGKVAAGVRVATADGTLAGNPLAEALEVAINDTASLWDRFTNEAAIAYRAKQAFIVAQSRKGDSAGGENGSTQ